MNVKKGASEDHAILQCNLFLGLGLDAFLAIGKLPDRITQHVWVVTREPNGDVRFWETTRGCFYTLPQRWTGLFMEGVEAKPLDELDAKAAEAQRAHAVRQEMKAERRALKKRLQAITETTERARMMSAYDYMRLYTVTHGNIRLHTVTHDSIHCYTLLHTVTHGHTRLNPVTDCSIVLYTVTCCYRRSPR